MTSAGFTMLRLSAGEMRRGKAWSHGSAAPAPGGQAQDGLLGRARWLVPGGAPVFPRPCIGRMATRRSRSFALEQRAVKVHLELGQPVDIMGIHLYAGPVPEIVALAGMI